jgi:Type II secretion system (T2SS), protein E, N-terminal domain
VEHPNKNFSPAAVKSVASHAKSKASSTLTDEEKEADRLEAKVIFGLIDRILPFEACLYHEILPLFLEERTLHLGMVTLTDVAALDYARKILSFLNYSLVPQAIASEMQHRILSQYLQFKGQGSTVEEEPTVFYEAEEISQLRAEIQNGAVPTSGTQDPGSKPVTAPVLTPDVAPRVVTPRVVTPRVVTPASAPRPSFRPIDRETLIVEAPEALEAWSFGEELPAPIASPNQPSTNQPSTNQPSTNQPSTLPLPNGSLFHHPLVMDSTVIQSIGEDDDVVVEKENSAASSVSASSVSASSVSAPQFSLPTPGDALPTLAIKTAYLKVSPEELKALDSTELLENLLGQVLESGIGRLYFEHQVASGRVLSSNSGVLQSMVEALPIDRFDSLIWALKNLMRVSPEPVTEPVQVEIERWHEKNRLLLRLRLMPKWDDHEIIGEDATLQILRGAALRFYQQQQSTNLRRDTLLVAKNLQLKVQALQQRTKGLTPQEDAQT